MTFTETQTEITTEIARAWDNEARQREAGSAGQAAWRLLRGSFEQPGPCTADDADAADAADAAKEGL